MLSMMYFRKIFLFLTDSIFPPSEDELRVRNTDSNSLRALYEKGTHADTVFLFPYRNEVVRALLWQLKYKKDMRATQLLGKALYEHLTQNALFEHIVIPIPLSKKRTMERGYNQVALVAQEAAIQGNVILIREDILMRTTHTERQTTLARYERLANMHDVFMVAKPKEVSGKNILVLDDVVTTGATLREAKGTLLRAGAKSVTCIALAH